MKDVTTRRTLLRAVGVTATATLAGCNTQQSSDAPTNNTDTSNTQGDGTTSETEEETDSTQEDTSDISLKTLAEGDIDWAGERNNKLTYVTAGGKQHVVYAGESEPSFDRVTGRWNIKAVDGGVAYTGEEDFHTNSPEYHVMSRGEQLAQFGDTTEGGLADVLEGEPLWLDARGEEPKVMQGQQEVDINHPLEDIKGLGTVGDELAYVVYSENEYGSEVPDTFIVGGTVIDDSDQFGVSALTYRDIDGTPAYVKQDRNGEYIQWGNQQVGGEYTTVPDGEIRWFGELDNSLAFVAKVADDRMEVTDRREEEVFWYDGEEIDRAEIIKGRAIVDGEPVYKIADTDRDGLIRDGDILGEYASNPTDIDGTLAYSEPLFEGDEKQHVVYGGEELESYQDIQHIFELDADLAFLGYTKPGDKTGEIMKET